jgi:hypothetical protein
LAGNVTDKPRRTFSSKQRAGTAAHKVEIDSKLRNGHRRKGSDDAGVQQKLADL